MLPVQAIDTALPALFLTSRGDAQSFWEYFTAHIRNANTRRAYFHAVRRFSAWCQGHGLTLPAIGPVHVAAYVEGLLETHSKPTAKQHLAALRALFDWMVVRQAIPSNPATPVRGPRFSQRRGKTPVLQPDEMRALLESIGTERLIDLRDRALIALMAYTFARVGAAVAMTVGDYFVQGRRGWVRLQEKGGKVNEMPCHHNLEQYLEDWIAGAGLRADDPLFPGFRNDQPTRAALAQPNVFLMVRRRAAAAGIRTRINCHSFRATGITTYLKNGGRLEVAQQMAGHESPRTTELYDRRSDAVALDEVERIVY
jgi:site-specific recombinase XerD